MKKRLFAMLFVICIMMGTVLPAAFATETEETTEATEETRREFSTEKSGTCGDDLTWELDGHTLTITGSGEMDAGCPWEFYKDTIHTVIFKGDVTTVGDEAFASCNNLEKVEFGDALVEIGVRAFYSCNALEVIRVPDTFRKFNAECFMDCDSLEAVICEGPMPSFRGSCLYTNHTVVVYYAPDIPWPASETDRLVSNFGGRVYVQAGTSDALAEYREDTVTKKETEATEAPVEATEAVETVPQTEPAAAPVAVTEPVTEPAQAPAETVLQTEPQTAAAEETEETEAPEASQTEPEEQTLMEKAGSNGWIWVVIVAAGLTCLLLLALVIRMITHKDGKYSA